MTMVEWGRNLVLPPNRRIGLASCNLVLILVLVLAGCGQLEKEPEQPGGEVLSNSSVATREAPASIPAESTSNSSPMHSGDNTPFEYSGSTGASLSPIPNLSGNATPYAAVAISGAWNGFISTESEESIKCTRGSDPGSNYWIYEVTTSQFTQFDSGSENPGEDFILQLYISQDSETRTGETNNSVFFQFVDNSGQHVFLTGYPGDEGQAGPGVGLVDDRRSVTFSVTENMAALGPNAANGRVSITGEIRCVGIE